MKLNKMLTILAISTLTSTGSSFAIQKEYSPENSGTTTVVTGVSKAVLQPVSSGIKVKVDLAQGSFDLGSVNVYSQEMMAKLAQLQDPDFVHNNNEAYVEVDCQAILENSPSSDFSALASEVNQLPAASSSSDEQERDEYVLARDAVVNGIANVQPLGCALYARMENTPSTDEGGVSSTTDTDNIFLVVITPNIARIMEYSGPQAEVSFSEQNGKTIMTSSLAHNGWLRSQVHATSDGSRSLVVASGIESADSVHPVAIVAQGHQFRLGDLISNPGIAQSHTVALTMTYEPLMVVQ